MRFQMPFRSGNRSADTTPGNATERKTPSPDAKRNLILLIVNSVVFTAIYFACNQNGFWPIFPIYAVLLTGLALGFVIYNRGFSRRGLSEEMLPSDWSEEKRREFIEDGERRLARSRWMLTLILPLVLAFLLDFLYLWIVDLTGWGV